jgi:hypothetical protein
MGAVHGEGCVQLHMGPPLALADVAPSSATFSLQMN